MSDLTAVRDLLAPTNPVPDGQLAATADAPQARVLLATILATARTDAAPDATILAAGRRRRQRRGRLVAVAAVAAVLMTAGVLVTGPGGGSQPAYAGTPPVLPYATTATAPGGPVLERIATAAEKQPPLPQTGHYRYVRTEGWALNSAIGGGHVTSALVSHQSESWRLPDGHGRIRTTTGESLVDRIGSQETLDAVLAKPASEQIILGEGDYGLEPLANLDALPYGDPTAFAMAVQHDTNAEIPAGAHLANAIADLFHDHPLPPAARAKVWRLLATIPGVTYRGPLTDRIGRHGMAVTVDDDGAAHGLPERFLFVIDPTTGQLLEYDDILTTDPGKLNVHVPAVLELTVYLDAGYTRAATSRPAG